MLDSYLNTLIFDLKGCVTLVQYNLFKMPVTRPYSLWKLKNYLWTTKSQVCLKQISAGSSLVPRPVRAIRVTRGGLEPSAIGEFSRQAWQVTSHPKSPRTTENEAVPDPALEISWGPGHPDPWIRGTVFPGLSRAPPPDLPLQMSPKHYVKS